jgi:hypothetical protein
MCKGKLYSGDADSLTPLAVSTAEYLVTSDY